MHYQAINFFVSDVNLQKTAMMDNILILKVIEKIAELKYMGSYFSDKVPQPSKYAFAIINSAASNDRGDHWIVIA